jgi:hypothetical protein
MSRAIVYKCMDMPIRQHMKELGSGNRQLEDVC